ncbi:cyclin-dependent kinase inhibitor 1B [Microcaecilia unicolor]|uniref:Cyclin-dependent kinase inhibitor 1B n=1 Tax=Microcaecilia unicolor TaxID=1415580 RepID=A0A6P7Z3S1_9AMPH|nr:cyclin-dependent kinase inhibitor 1B [Microcaecilia unicolor]
MSNIRISNGSPNPERMEARQMESPKFSARRNLFGRVDPEELKKEFEKQQKDMEDECKERWNFDFKNHRPLAGRYQWKTVDQEDMPEFYSRPLKRSCLSSSEESLDVNGDWCAVNLPRSQGVSEGARLVDQKIKESESRTDLIDQCTGKRKRSATDDSSPQNKRASTTETTALGDSPDSTLEQTPKKPSPRRHQT